MAKTKGPLFSLEARGTIADALTFSKRKSGQQVRFQRKQKDVLTAGRIAHRAEYSAAVLLWNYLSSTQKLWFKTAVRGIAMTPFSLFIKNYLLDKFLKIWTGVTGQNLCRALTFDGTYIYVGLSTTPAYVVKINPSTMATVSTWTGSSGQNNCFGLTFDGTYIYAGLSTTPAYVIRNII